MDPLVSAVVLTYRSPRDTLACVRALLAQTIADKLQVIVVDNHSETDAIGILRTQLPGDPRIRIVETSRNLGYGKGNNFGVRYAMAEYLLIVNPDNVLPPNALECMVAHMDADAKIGILAPRLTYPDGTVRDSARAFPTFFDVFVKRTVLRHAFLRRLTGLWSKNSLARCSPVGQEYSCPTGLPMDVDWVAGACLFLRREFFKELGGFDPRFFLFFEDMDLCRRTWSLGKRVVYDPSITVADREHRLSAGGVVQLITKRTVRSHLASAVRYFWKWQGVKLPRSVL